MQFEPVKNANYCASVVKIKNIVPFNNCDNVVGTTIFGFQAIIQKGHEVGELGLVFPAETQLSRDYCYNNNLYRHNDLNKDQSEKGYIEDNRRVKAIKFRGNVSNCLFMPLESLKWTGIKIEDLKEGDEFDVLKGHEICKKYVIREPREQRLQAKKASRVDKKYMPEHVDTDNFFKFRDTISPEQEIIVTQKLHGTSIRIGHTIVNRKLTWIEKILQRLGVKIQQTTFDYIYGSRRVIKDPNNPDQHHFYDDDIWTKAGEKMRGLLPTNYLVFAELVGYTFDGKEIQKDYTYGQPLNTQHLYVYRISIVNDEGFLTDLTWDQTVEFCKQRGISTVVELWRGKNKDFKVESYLDIEFANSNICVGLPVVPVGNGFVDEGVVIRTSELTPRFFKAKSPLFLEHETKILDTGEEDLESSQVES